MTHALEKRLASLEADEGSATAVVWANPHQTAEEINAKVRAAKLDPARKVFVVGWKIPLRAAFAHLFGFLHLHS